MDNVVIEIAVNSRTEGVELRPTTWSVHGLVVATACG